MYLHKFLLVPSINIGDTAHLMAITPTPYGASTTSTSNFTCILGDSDKGMTNVPFSNRYILRGPLESPTLQLPVDTSTTVDTENSFIVTHLPPSIESQGVYKCETFSGGVTTTVPVTILAGNSKQNRVATNSFLKVTTLNCFRLVFEFSFFKFIWVDIFLLYDAFQVGKRR